MTRAAAREHRAALQRCFTSPPSVSGHWEATDMSTNEAPVTALHVKRHDDAPVGRHGQYKMTLVIVMLMLADAASAFDFALLLVGERGMH